MWLYGLWSFLKYETLSKQRKMASIWVRRKTRISTPVATTTNAEWQDGTAGHMTSSRTWMLLDGCQTNHLWIYNPRKCQSCTRCFTRYVYFFCAIRKWRLPDCPEEDPLQFLLSEEGSDVKHTFSPSYILLVHLWSLQAGLGERTDLNLDSTLHCGSFGGGMVCLQ